MAAAQPPPPSLQNRDHQGPAKEGAALPNITPPALLPPPAGAASGEEGQPCLPRRRQDAAVPRGAGTGCLGRCIPHAREQGRGRLPASHLICLLLTPPLRSCVRLRCASTARRRACRLRVPRTRSEGARWGDRGGMAGCCQGRVSCPSCTEQGCPLVSRLHLGPCTQMPLPPACALPRPLLARLLSGLPAPAMCTQAAATRQEREEQQEQERQQRQQELEEE